MVTDFLLFSVLCNSEKVCYITELHTLSPPQAGEGSILRPDTPGLPSLRSGQAGYAVEFTLSETKGNVLIIYSERHR